MRTHLLWLIHIYTALGIPLAGLTLYYCVKGDIKTAFLCMLLALFIDATDGALARRFNVVKELDTFDGRKLDDLVDFLNFVLVPVAMAFILKILPEDRLYIGIIPIMASAYGFSQVSAKTEDGFFTGFPSYWNIVVFYLYLFKFSILLNTAIIIIFSAAVFLPIKYVVPFKTKLFAMTTNIFCIVWGISLIAICFSLPAQSQGLIIFSTVFLFYYFAISIYLDLSYKISSGH